MISAACLITWLRDYTYAPIGAYQFLKTCRQYIAKFVAMCVFTICLARLRKRGDDTISLPSGAYREPGLVVKTIDHQGWTRYIWCHDDVLKRVTLGYLWCEVACWKSPEEILRERKCHLWRPLCGESFVMWWDLWQCASSQCLAPRSFTSNIHPPNQDGAFEKEGRGF